MLPRVSGVRPIEGYVLELQFTDGTSVPMDFQQRIVGRGGVFLALEDAGFFKRVEVDVEAGTIVWPNGVDFCPDVLYAEAMGKEIDELRRAVGSA